MFSSQELFDRGLESVPHSATETRYKLILEGKFTQVARDKHALEGERDCDDAVEDGLGEAPRAGAVDRVPADGEAGPDYELFLDELWQALLDPEDAVDGDDPPGDGRGPPPDDGHDVGDPFPLVPDEPAAPPHELAPPPLPPPPHAHPGDLQGALCRGRWGVFTVS